MTELWRPQRGTRTLAPMLTVIGQVVADAGLVSQVDAWGGHEPYRLPATGYERNQPRPLPLRYQHHEGFQLGEVGHLERSRASGLMAVATIPDNDLADLLADGPWFLSDKVACRSVGPLTKGGARLHELSLVRKSANVNTRPIRYARTDIARNAGGHPAGLPLNWRSTWDRAHKAMSAYAYRRADHLVIHDLDPADLDAARARLRAAVARPPARPSAAPKPPARSRVRLDGVWLDDRRAAQVLARMGYEYADDGSLLSLA